MVGAYVPVAQLRHWLWSTETEVPIGQAEQFVWPLDDWLKPDGHVRHVVCAA